MTDRKFFDEVQVKRDWENSSAIREEFENDYLVYFHYRKAMANGQVKFLRRGDHGQDR